MRRTWNGLVWGGFALVLAAAVTYIPIFVRFAFTRDVPWANLLLFVAGFVVLAAGLKRAYGEPERYGGRVSGAVLAVLSLALFGLFCWGMFVFSRHVPASTGAPQAGQPAPEFTLADANGKPVSLAALRQSHRAVLLIFYRGYW